jgi:hypothetical protein
MQGSGAELEAGLRAPEGARGRGLPQDRPARSPHLSVLLAATQNTSLSRVTRSTAGGVPAAAAAAAAAAIAPPAAAAALASFCSSLLIDCVVARRTRPNSSSMLPGNAYACHG